MNPNPIRCSSCGTTLDAAAPGGLCPRCLMAGAMLPTGLPTGARTPPPTVEQVAAAFPQLEVLALIGAGGMGAVFRARQPKLNRLVALKVLPASLAERDPAFAERFEREGRMLARLHHPNIVTVHDSGRAGDFFYLLMEHVDGVNLRQAMHAGRFSPAQALGIVPRICDALQFAHDEGVLHRDIKPENILLDAKGRVKLADFGIGKIIGEASEPAEGMPVSPDASLTQAGTALGTPQYMAPEQREQPELVDHRADIYSLGVVFYELLTGELPKGKFTPPSALTGSDPRIDAIVRQAMEKERGDRQQSAGEVRTQVETVAAGGNVRPSSAAARAGETENLPPRFSRAAIAGAVWLGIALFGVLTIAGPIKDDLPWWQVLLSVAVMLPTVSAPFGTSILGWVALAQIRRSAGKIHGLGLALFDALLFPVLALDVGMWLVVGKIWRANPPEVGNPVGAFLSEHAFLIPLFALTLCVVVDVLIIRRVWRALIRPADVTPPAWASRLKLGLLIGLVLAAGVAGERLVSDYLVRRAGAAIPEEMARQAITAHLIPASVRWREMTFEPNTVSPSDVIVRFAGLEELRGVNGQNNWQPVQGMLNLRTLDGIRWHATGTESLGHLQFTFELPRSLRANTVGAQLARQVGRSNATVTVGEAGIPPASAPTFGPVMDRIVNDFIDLDSGQILSPPANLSELLKAGKLTLSSAEIRAWMRSSGADVAISKTKPPSLLLMDGGMVSGGYFDNPYSGSAVLKHIDQITPEEAVHGAAVAAEPQLMKMSSQDMWSLEPTTVNIFKTREGGIGVLEITGYTDNPRGVRIRYKFVTRTQPRDNRL